MPRRAEARDLACRAHLDSQRRVSALEPLEGEHRGLDTHVVARRRVAAQPRGGGGEGLVADHRARGRLDEVDADNLGREGERAGGAQVALDDLDVATLSDELHIVGPRDLQRGGQLVCDLVDQGELRRGDGLRRQHESGVARVDARVLDVLRDGVHQQRAVLRDGVDIDLLAALDELAHDDGPVEGDVGGHAQVADQLFLRVGHIHRRARQHVRRPHQAGVAHLIAEGKGVGFGGEHAPQRLVDADRVAEC
mmetsp:Transcript_74452/g.205214  ORF Transcript_74452/g.205214 Transcript_74452/m.205214 type:complete len:251 (-) Transcript_74452:435-1187(-)